MNNARMWCVVSPTIGLPLFLAGVALTSLTVHHYVLTNTTWVGAFWSGEEVNTAAVDAPASTTVAASSFTANADAGEAFIVLPDGRSGRVVFDPPVTVAAAESGAERLAAD